jgi:hypothetical protein
LLNTQETILFAVTDAAGGMGLHVKSVPFFKTGFPDSNKIIDI